MKPICPADFPWKDYKRYTYPLGLDLGPLSFLSGLTASTYDAATDQIVATGDLKAQTGVALEKISLILKTAGYGFDDAVSLIQYVAPSAFEQLGELRAIIRAAGLGGAVAHIVPVTRLLRRDALVELEVIAARGGQRSPAGACAMRILAGEQAIVMTGATDAPSGATTQVALKAQVDAIGRMLKTAGCDWSNVARCRLVLASDRVDEVESATAMVRAMVPELPVIPAVGVKAVPAGTPAARFSVEWSLAGGNTAKPVESAGALVRRAGPFLVVTGMLGGGADTGITAQAERIYGQQLPQLLAEAGLGIECIVQTVEWLTRDALPEYKDTGSIRRNTLREPFPVSSGLVCSVLPGGARLAVDVVAIDPALASGGIWV